MSARILDTEVKRACLKRLYTEHNSICFQFRVTLNCPLIEIADLDKRWGTWDPRNRSITISQDLIFTQPWHVVVEVLKHEMAHQFVTEIFRANEQHGPMFKQACTLLGVHPAFANATTDISEVNWKQTHAPSADDALLNKVQKLLNLANSSNEHEAWLAAQRVREILAKYNLDTQNLNAQQEFDFTVIDVNSSRVSRVHKMICSILTSYYFVSVLLTEGYQVEAKKATQCIEIYGKRVNVVMAEYVYAFLLQQCESLWMSYKKLTGSPGSHRLSYQVGLLLGFRDKLERENRAWISRDENASKMLATSGEKSAELREFMSRRFPRVSKRSSGSASVNSDAMLDGRSQGENIVIRRGVEETRNGIRYLT